MNQLNDLYLRPACGGLTHRKHRMQNAVISVEWLDDGVSKWVSE